MHIYANISGTMAGSRPDALGQVRCPGIPVPELMKASTATGRKGHALPRSRLTVMQARVAGRLHRVGWLRNLLSNRSPIVFVRARSPDLWVTYSTADTAAERSPRIPPWGAGRCGMAAIARSTVMTISSPGRSLFPDRASSPIGTDQRSRVFRRGFRRV